MDFKEQYKQCAEIMDPSPEAMERMRNNILAQTAAPAKKTIPFKKIAYAGSALAACAVIAVAGAAILPRLSTNEMAEAVMEDSSKSLNCAATEAEGQAAADNKFAENGYMEYAAQADDADADCIACEVADPECEGAAEESENEFFADSADSNAAVNWNNDAASTTTAIESVFAPTDEYSDISGGSADMAEDAPQELIVFVDGYYCFTVGDAEYIALPEDISDKLEYSDDCAVTIVYDADSEAYLIYDNADLIRLERRSDGHDFGYYCLSDKYNDLVSAVTLT